MKVSIFVPYQVPNSFHKFTQLPLLIDLVDFIFLWCFYFSFSLMLICKVTVNVLSTFGLLIIQVRTLFTKIC